PRSPWQNPYVERLIGTVRRECLDRVLIFGEAHLRQILASYAAYYNEVRTHLALCKDAPAVGQSSGPAPLLLSQSCPDCTTITSGYDFRKGQETSDHARDHRSQRLISLQGFVEIAREHIAVLVELPLPNGRAAQAVLVRAQGVFNLPICRLSK